MSIATAVRGFLEAQRTPGKQQISSSKHVKRLDDSTGNFARTLTLCARSTALRMALRASIAEGLSAHTPIQ